MCVNTVRWNFSRPRRIYCNGVRALSVNKKNNDNIKRVAAYAFSVVCGIAASAALILLFSGVMYAFGFPPGTAGTMSLLAFAAGCALCGFVCGCIKQRGGLRIGLICAGFMCAAVLAGSLVTGEFTGGMLVPKLLTAAVSACIGSVCAVNRRRDP